MDPLLEFAMAIKAIGRELERGTNEVMRPLGITGPQADAITVIGQAGPLSLKDLGELLIAESGHPSRLVDRLVEAGWVERRPGEADRRSIELELTAKGRRLEKKVAAAREQVLALAREALGERDVADVGKALGELAQLTSYADLINRRRELFERHDPG